MDPAERVVAGMISTANNNETACAVIDEMGQLLTEAHFTDPTLRTLFRAAGAFRSISSAVLSSQAVADLSRGSDAGTAALVAETFEALRAHALAPADARWAAHELVKEREHHLTTVALRDAAEIAAGSVTEERADGRPGRTWSGAADAREWASSRISEIDSEHALAETPAGEVGAEGAEVLRAYMAARSEDRSRRPQLGIATFDTLTGGLAPGQLGIVAAPSGAGKSHVCVQSAYLSVYEQGLHVFFATSETVRVIVRNRLVARHSRSDRFADMRAELGIPYGLNSADLDRGELPDEHLPLFAEVARSMDSGEGSLWLAQSPYGQTVKSLFNQVAARARTRPVDYVIVDYLMLMSAGHRRESERADLKSVVIDAARLASDYDSGRGVALLSPWQINRQGQADMIKTGEPNQNSLAETAEAVNSASLVFSLYPEGERTDRRFGNLTGHLLKNRTGATLVGKDAGVNVKVDYATSHFSERLSADDATGGFGATNGFGPPDEGAFAGLL